MSPSETAFPLESFVTFGDLLKYLRRRARLTQREVAIAVGYSEAQVSRLEQNLRPPDLAALTALFIPALYLDDEPEIVARLMELAAQARGENLPRNGVVTFARSVRQEVVERVRTVEENTLNNLPLQLTSFIGREHEIIEIKTLLTGERGNARLVTLTGGGGSGKTRLALETAKHLVDAYRDGVWLIELAPLSDPDLVLQTISATLGISESHDEMPSSALIHYLRAKQILLILDNCEQVVAVVAHWAEEILHACPGVEMIATSREALNIPGEVRFPVPPLSLPDPASSSRDMIFESEAVRLFAERARSVFPAFVLNEESIPSVTRICRQLDGMPLAIELAAARTGLLSIQQIATRLRNNLQFLGGGSRTLPRHQTLEATIEWSYELLSEGERTVFARLSVFSGGWTLEAAEAVASDAALLLPEKIVDLLLGLVNKSLIIVGWQRGDDARYTMLQMIHVFAHEKLRAMDELVPFRARHFDYFFRMAQQAEENLFAEQSSLDWAEAEIDNLRAALKWALEPEADGSHSEERTGQAMDMMTHVWPLWLSRGYLSEGHEWMKQLLAAHRAATLSRARALMLAADFLRYHGDYTGQIPLIQEALTISRKLVDKKRMALALMEMGLVERDLLHYSEAIPLLMESLVIFQELNETLWLYRVSFLLAEVYMSDENPQAAKPLWQKGLELSRAAKDQWHVGWGLEGLGHVERVEEHFERARQLFMESLGLRRNVMDKAGITYMIESFAQLAAAQKQFQRAVILWGAGEQLHKTLNLLLPPSREKIYTSLLVTTRTQLGEAEFKAAWSEGQAMNMQQAIDYALGLSDN